MRTRWEVSPWAGPSHLCYPERSMEGSGDANPLSLNMRVSIKVTSISSWSPSPRRALRTIGSVSSVFFGGTETKGWRATEVCIYTRVYSIACTCMCTHVPLRRCVCISIQTSYDMHIYTRTHTHPIAFIYILMSTYIHINCTHILVQLYIHVYIYTYTCMDMP